MNKTEKKYTLIPAQGNVGYDFVRPRYQIKALKDFTTYKLDVDEHGIISAIQYKVKKDELGGYVSSEDNLAQSGTCWIFPDADVSGSCSIVQEATVQNSKLRGNVKISCDSHISDVNAYGGVQIGGSTVIINNRTENQNKRINLKDKVILAGDIFIHDFDNIEIHDETLISGRVEITGSNIDIGDNSKILGNDIKIEGPCSLSDRTFLNGTIHISNITTQGTVNLRSKEIINGAKEPSEVLEIIGDKSPINLVGTLTINNASIHGFGTINGSTTPITLDKDITINGNYATPETEKVEPAEKTEATVNVESIIKKDTIKKIDKYTPKEFSTEFKSSHGINDTWVDTKTETEDEKDSWNYPDGDSESFSYTETSTKVTRQESKRSVENKGKLITVIEDISIFNKITVSINTETLVVSIKSHLNNGKDLNIDAGGNKSLSNAKDVANIFYEQASKELDSEANLSERYNIAITSNAIEHIVYLSLKKLF